MPQATILRINSISEKAGELSVRHFFMALSKSFRPRKIRKENWTQRRGGAEDGKKIQAGRGPKKGACFCFSTSFAAGRCFLLPFSAPPRLCVKFVFPDAPFLEPAEPPPIYVGHDGNAPPCLAAPQREARHNAPNAGAFSMKWTRPQRPLRWTVPLEQFTFDLQRFRWLRLRLASSGCIDNPRGCLLRHPRQARPRRRGNVASQPFIALIQMLGEEVVV